MRKLTDLQLDVLETLNERPADVFLLRHHAASCRRSLERRGFVSIWRMADNCFRYSITEAGRAALEASRTENKDG